MHYAYVNGKILPREEGTISIMDRGFLFGDGVYDVMKVVKGTPLFLRPHLNRLKFSCEKGAIPYPSEVEEAMEALLHRSGTFTGSLYIQVTRGTHPRHHLPPEGLKPTLILFTQDYTYAARGEVETGYTAVSVPDFRWQRCDIKTISLMGAILAKLECHRRNADEVLLVGDKGEIHEGGSTNFFAIRGEEILTYPLGPMALPGITRQVIVEEIKRSGWRLVERPPYLAEKETWEECFITGTLTGVMPLRSIDNVDIGDGNYPRTLALYDALMAREAEERGKARESR